MELCPPASNAHPMKVLHLRHQQERVSASLLVLSLIPRLPNIIPWHRLPLIVAQAHQQNGPQILPTKICAPPIHCLLFGSFPTMELRKRIH